MLLDLSLASGDDLDVRSFHALENLSAAFRVDVVARARDDALDFANIVGKGATLKLQHELGTHTWAGVCAEVAQTAVEPSGLSTYELRIVPELWLLTHRVNHRTFQRTSIPAAVTKLLGEWGISTKLHLSEDYPELPMRVQYGESDYHFVRRLLADAGISFLLATDSKGRPEVVLTDAPEKAEAIAPPLPFRPEWNGSTGQGQAVTAVQITAKVAPERVVIRDHDFRRPDYALDGTHGGATSRAPQLEHYRFAAGHSLAAAPSSNGAGEPIADSLGTYRHADRHATTRARNELQGLQANRNPIGFSAVSLDLFPGCVFSISGHPQPSVSKRLLVTQLTVSCDVSASALQVSGRAVAADLPFKPVVDASPAPHADPFTPLRKAGKPHLVGVESAIVTGPQGEAVHTDEYGRVTVQFPWDRESSSSPWLRVSQAWAGPGYGIHTIPRVGNEVLVAHQQGDPDHPVVVGRVHNATAPTPNALPEFKARTTLRTSTVASTATTGGTPYVSGGVGTAPPTTTTGANEITFDDTAGKELFYVQAERDLHKIVKRDELELTEGSRHIHVNGDLVFSAGGKISIVAGKDLIVKGGPKVLLNPKTPPAPAKKPAPLRKPKPKPHESKGTDAAAEAAKYLYKYESQLQAEGITLPCPTNESCANFVSSMLARVGAIHGSSRTVNVGVLSSTLQNDYHWKKVSAANAKPGDVWIVDQNPSPPGEQHTEIVSSNHDGHITLIGSNNHPVDSNQQVNYDSSSANAGMADSYILAPP